MKKIPKIILGIDPGTLFMGYSVIHVQNNAMTMEVMGVLKLHPKQDNHARLEVIYKKVAELIREYRPHCFAIEAPFFGKNVQSMLKLGRAQGVAIAAAIGSGLEVCEYSPRKIKQSITGNGNAGKDQVWKMLQQIMQVPEGGNSRFDASDALAVAVCHHFQASRLTVQPGFAAEPVVGKKIPTKKAGDWKAFLQLHPNRVR